MTSRKVSVRTTLRNTPPRVSFTTIAQTILGNNYELSVVLIADTFARRLNREHRGKDVSTDVLSFPIDTNEGEIFINWRRVQQDAATYNHTPIQHLIFIFIHGCLHLKGYEHGSAMEAQERRYLNTFSA